MKLVIDSSVFITHLGQNDEFSSDSKLFFTTIFEQKEKIIIPTLIIAETLTILRQQNHPSLKPIYKTFNGWHEDLSQIKKYQDLPKKCRVYLEYLERELRIPIKYISLAAEREAIVVK